MARLWREGFVEWDRWACDIKAHRYVISRIVLPAPTCDTAMFVALHEYAHVALGPGESPMPQGDDEIAASRLALHWIKPVLYSKALRFYLSCIAPSEGVRKKYRDEVRAKLEASVAKAPEGREARGEED